MDDSSLPVLLGGSPLLGLLAQQLQGEITAETALALAASPEVVGELTPEAVRQGSAWAERLAFEDWEHAVAFHRLLQAATMAANDDSPGWTAARRGLTLDWLTLVARAVSAVPDGRLFREAKARGEALLHEAEIAADEPLKAEVLHNLGILHLDPYTAGRASTDYERQMQSWRQSLYEHYGKALAGVPPEELEVPAPAEALRVAEGYLERAVALETGVTRGRGLKALGQAREWRTVVGDRVEREAIVSCYREALTLLSPTGQPLECAGALAALARWDEPLPAEPLDALLAIPLERIRVKLGLEIGAQLALQLVALLRTRDAEDALVYSSRLWPFTEPEVSSETRAAIWQQQCGLMMEISGVGTLPSAAVANVADIGARIRADAEREGWEPDRLAIGLIGLALCSPQADQELVGLELLTVAEETAPELGSAFRGALTHLRMKLLIGAAVNALNAGGAAEAVERYNDALALSLRLELRSSSFELLRRIADLGVREECQTILVALLAARAIVIERELGDAGARWVQEVCRLLLSRIAKTGEVNPTLIMILFQVAKGLRFSALLHSVPSTSWRQGLEESELAQRLRLARAEVAAEPTAAPRRDDSPLNPALFLVGNISSLERNPGAGPAQRLANLQQAYDEEVNRRLLTAADSSLQLFGRAEDMQARLDERTVLVSYYLGTGPAGEMALYLLVLTREEMWMSFGVGDLPSGVVNLQHEERAVEVSLFGMAVQDLLEVITATPWKGTVDPRAAKTLADSVPTYLTRLRLDEMRARGKDHLCIVPHGALHFYPFHLLGPSEQPLAADWIVTFLPSLALLTRDEARAARPSETPRSLPVASFGLGFAGGEPHDLPELPQAVDEARAIARLFGVSAKVDAEATEAAFASALERARYVHVASHGAHCLHAPAFQQIFLWPDPPADGVLYAHEILDLDLSGVECLTLSACETALGRFDASDNLRGLPASFFLAGARTIIGTLWPVETSSAAYFFERFYEQIRTGVGRLDAFAAAQRRTRESFPEYRDWGAFYLAGDWREPDQRAVTTTPGE